jgi:hypothetical protein
MSFVEGPVGGEREEGRPHLPPHQGMAAERYRRHAGTSYPMIICHA